jgi:hypothetical protein
VIDGYTVRHSGLAGDRSPRKIITPDGVSIDEWRSYRDAVAQSLDLARWEPQWRAVLEAHRSRSPEMLRAAVAILHYGDFFPAE